MIFLRRNQFIEKRLPLFASSKRIGQEFEDARLHSYQYTLSVLEISIFHSVLNVHYKNCVPNTLILGQIL